MLFGLTNTLITIQSLMNCVLQGLLRKSVLVFLNDILIYIASWSLQLHHLEVVLRTLQQHHLFAKLSKCHYGLQEVEYLGHIVSGKVVSMDQNKVKAVLDWKIPTTAKQLHGLLGLTRYYH